MKNNKILSKNDVKTIIEYKYLEGFVESDIRFIEDLIIRKIKEKLIPKLKMRIKRDVFPIKNHKWGDVERLGKCYKIIEGLFR